MRIFFFIQGEGRGHQTQAIALYHILQQAGYTVTGAIVGTTPGRGIPTLLQQHLPIPMQALPSPALLYSEKSKALAVWTTFQKNAIQIPHFWQQAKLINTLINAHKPDVIINFYEMLCGIWRWQFPSKIPILSVAHQYLLQHPEFKTPPSRLVHRSIINNVTRLSAIGTTRKLALSFYEMPDASENAIYVVPPLLRPEVQELSPVAEPFLLAYMTHYKLGQDLEKWCQNHPETNVLAFWDNPNANDISTPLPNLTFRRVNAEHFLDAMRRCQGLVSTAGFESICEAMYLGKPIMLFPTPRHFEQAVNAYDAERAGTGIRVTSFLDLDRFLEYLPQYHSVQVSFQNWQHRSNDLFLKHIKEVTK
ncbi:MAG: glycosyltransferase family protein [Siphonobacter sp.]